MTKNPEQAKRTLFFFLPIVLVLHKISGDFLPEIYFIQALEVSVNIYYM
jgi:hypothetical protein